VEARYPLLAPHLAELLYEGRFAKLPRVRGEVCRLFTASRKSFDYSHHASLGVCAGQLYAFWSNGRDGEDLPGQVQCWCLRTQEGSWTAPQILAEAPVNPQVYPETTTVINGGTAIGAPFLTSFYSEYRGRVADGAGGEGKWSLPLVTGVHLRDPQHGYWRHLGVLLEDLLLTEGPRRTANGRWLMTGEDHRGRTRVAYSDAEDPADPSWRVVGVPKGEGPCFKNEPSWFQRPDGKLALFLRDDGGSRCLWLSESTDEGETWSVPRPTNFPDATAKCHVGQLNDGTYYCISNPNPSGERIPLTIALSSDGMVFDRMAILRDEPTAPRLPGRFKAPGYQYPHSLQYLGKLYVIYSRNKEDVEVLSIDVQELASLLR